MAHWDMRGVKWVVAATALAVMAGCAGVPEAQGPLRKETLHVLTQKMELLTLNAGQPGKVLQRTAVTGLPPGETLVGMDYRIAKGVLFALSSAGHLYTLDVPSGALKRVGSGAGVALQGSSFGVDFNPVADRVRVVSNTGNNLRLHPDTGALAATDPALAYAPGDVQAGQMPEVVAAGYTYNKKDEKLTTNYAIDRRSGTLLTQGSVEGMQPVVSPNTGQLRTVGPLGTGPLLDAAMDIADVTGAAFTAVRTASQATTKLYTIDLSSGKATLIGTVADGAAIVGLAVEP
ncbi:DUF4394 domain-containing protein [Rhodoferax sp.]|uniref:DUF4394 domain-containing protein n=1 Tax=Rhodoferax sp. TaxID=50421 RepID=UPI002ACDCC5C|nr:DUF4394 domain-containing protein [Rhodoferax sp.]MDZ7920310.1 DUF4394 domain-containing protein [Rhodoferax sp.]